MIESAFTPLVVPRVGEVPLDVRGATDKARTRGYADGFAEGRKVALEEARRQQAADHERMRQLQEAYLQQRGAALNAVRKSQVALDEKLALVVELSAARIEELAVELATAILGAELSDPARSAAHALRRAVEATPIDRWVRVAFSATDFAILTGVGNDTEGTDDTDATDVTDATNAATILHGVDIVAAPHVDPGGAIVEIEHGAVDTRVAGALRRAAHALHGTDDGTDDGADGTQGIDGTDGTDRTGSGAAADHGTEALT